MSLRPRAALLTLLLAMAGLAACSRSSVDLPTPRPTSPFAACPPSTAPAPTGPAALPAITLPCFTGGAPVALDRLGAPAVINLWASWCAPCRQELPQLQAFADEARGRVAVLGVVTDDPWDRAASAGADFGVHFPAVFDEQRTLLRALGRSALPVTVFVGADGSVKATDVSGALTLAKLRALAGQYLGYTP